jgi:hypothetical protein
LKKATPLARKVRMMAKLILEFDAIEEQREAAHAVNGLKYYGALTDLDVLFRSKLKYGPLTDEQHTIVEELQRQFFDITEGLLDDH